MAKMFSQLLAITAIFTAFFALPYVAYRTGVHNGRRQMAEYISEIRRIDRLNIMAPRTKEHE